MFNRNFMVVIFALISFLFIVPVSAQEATSEVPTPKTIEYIVSADSANLRTGAGTSFATAGQVLKGESLLIYDETPETEGWLRVYQEGEEDSYIADFWLNVPQYVFILWIKSQFSKFQGRGKVLLRSMIFHEVHTG